LVTVWAWPGWSG